VIVFVVGRVAGALWAVIVAVIGLVLLLGLVPALA
jgi:hypothetical protein